MNESDQAIRARPRRTRTAGLVLWVRTCWRTAAVLREHRLTRFTPVFVFLLLFGLLLSFLDTIAPLAPFVYSLI